MQVFNDIIFSISNYLFEGAINYVILGVTLAIILVLVIAIIVSIFSKNTFSYVALKYFISALVMVNISLSILEYIFKSEIFTTAIDVVVFSVLLVVITLLVMAFLNVAKVVKKASKKTTVKQPNNTAAVIEERFNNLQVHDNYREVIRLKCLSPTSYAGECDGFLDVAYLKSLLSLLNEKELSQLDRQELDEFEVYLMNFANRQPYRSERIKLNDYLSDFIKKLARYDVC